MRQAQAQHVAARAGRERNTTMSSENTTTAKAYSISDTATMLNVSTVRVHGLLADGKLKLAADPIQKGEKFVKAVTVESIQALQASRKDRAEGSRQYILTLTAEQAEQLKAQGFEVKPRFQKA